MEEKKKVKVLVVDDEFEVRETVKNMLFDTGFEIMSVSDAISALLTLKDHPDIRTIVSDYRLPGLGGKDWIDLVKHYYPQMEVIVMTGYDVARENVSDKAKVILKPFGREQLLELIKA